LLNLVFGCVFALSRAANTMKLTILEGDKTMAPTGNNFINFVSELIYGDLGVGELGTPPPAGAKNHIHWTRDNIPNSVTTTVTGNAFLGHHLDYMLARYEAWRSKYFQPPLRPWDGQSPMDAEQSATVPGDGPLPATTEALGTSIREYYNTTFRNSLTDELQDEVKAAYSYRYWAFMKWASDLRKRVLEQPVFHVHPVFDRTGTVLSEKDFTDIFHQVHHVWHPNGPIGSGWTQATPFFKTSVGQHIGKKEISRTQVGAEFFTFHRDHLELFDRWLLRMGQDKIQSINACAHDTDPNDPPPAGVNADFSGYPHIEDWSTSPPTVIFNDVHTTYWNGDLHEITNLGEMGQFFATDFNQFDGNPATAAVDPIPVPGVSDTGYHGRGHGLNSDLMPPVDNNHSPRFFAWHHFNDDVWIKREPRFITFQLVQPDDSEFPEPDTLTILRDLTSSADSIEPALAVAGIDLATGQGTLRVKVNVQTDPFDRTLDLLLTCEVLREGAGPAPVITLARQLSIIFSGMPTGAQRLQNTEFFENFVFDGSASAVDSDGDGPFKSDNLVFSPTPVGFKNSRIRITGYLTCQALPDGAIPSISGTISSAGQNVTGAATNFTGQLRQGDLIRANGQVRQVTQINSSTTLTLLEPFSPDLAAGTTYQRLDGFDHPSVLEIPLIQEKQAPDITVYLDRSTFSLEQVAAAGTTVFDDAFYVVLQDRTSRPFTIIWPPAVEPGLYGLIAPPVYSAGLYLDPAHFPLVELRDEMTGALIPDVTVAVTDMQPEDPGLHPAIPQRVTCPCTVTFTSQAAFAGLVSPGDARNVKLVVTATDRSGNQVTDDSLRVRLQFNPNPFMTDGSTHWLSADTRVFKIAQGQARFGVPAGWTNPNAFIQQVIANFRAGSGAAGGETFESLATDDGPAILEYSTTVGGNLIHNFALAKVRLQSAMGLDDLRVTFRLFRWGVASVEFNQTLAYRSALSGIGLLGRTTSNELASIPFFADARLAPSADMNLQPDGSNLFSFGPTGGSEAQSYFGAYLDINQSTPRFPQTYTGDGFFSGPLHPIRDLLEDHHQCMVVELLHADDPTVDGSTPGISDNLAQRNLLIVQTANPGSEITRTVQHAFNIDLTRSLRRPRVDPVVIIDPIHTHHLEPQHHHEQPPDADHGDSHDKILLQNCCEEIRVSPARPSRRGSHDHLDLHRELAHLEDSWLAQAPNLLAKFKRRLMDRIETEQRWTFDLDQWKSTTGLDELVFFWNNLPEDAEVELFLPGANVEEIFNFRSLRHAPTTVKIVDSQTLRLFPTGTTYLPIARFWGDNLAGLLKVKLPPGIKKGQRFKIDVVQMRADEARTLGGFQLNIQVEKAIDLWEAERRKLDLFHKRLSIKPKTDRWWPILARQVEFMRARVRGLIELANEEQPEKNPVDWKDPTEVQKGKKVRVILEKIQILNDQEPFPGGKEKFRFFARAWTPDNGGILTERVFPDSGSFSIRDVPKNGQIRLNAVLFDDWAENQLAIQIGGVEPDTLDPDDRLYPFRQQFYGDPTHWFGRYMPTGETIDPQTMKGWKLWLRIEPSGSTGTDLTRLEERLRKIRRKEKKVHTHSSNG
jgi:hypothetical protein